MAFLYKGEPRRGAIWAEQFARKMPGLPPVCLLPLSPDARGIRPVAGLLNCRASPKVDVNTEIA